MRIGLELRAVVLTVVCSPFAAWAADTWTDPYPGVRHLYRTTATPNRIHALTIDLRRPDIRVRATRYDDRRRTTSSFAAAYDCEMAVNGDFFSYETYSTSGLAIGRGERWTSTEDSTGSGFVAVGLDNLVEISAPNEVVNPPDEWMHDVVGGHPLLVAGGAARDFGECTGFCARNPRTAVGLSEDDSTLILVVVDGRSSVSAGMSLPELANLMINLGAHTALNLDGGGSSTMFVDNEGGVQNSPSDGAQRVVANHLGIAIVAPFGTVKGYVRLGDIYDMAAGIAGASVTLSTGETATTGDDGSYEITGVAAGAVTVTASAPGLSGQKMVTVYGEETSWGSIALAANPDEGEEPGADPGSGSDEDADGDTDAAGSTARGGCSTTPTHSGSRGLLVIFLLMIAHVRGHLRSRVVMRHPARHETSRA
jgi:hypothetical protein